MKSCFWIAVFQLCLVLQVLTASGCGRSPLLNHDNENDSPVGNAAVEGAARCQLSWPLNDGRLCARLVWTLPPAVGENRFRLIFENEISNSRLDVWADMPDMGHGTAPVVLNRTSATEADVSEVWLTMSGVWVIHVKVNGHEAAIEVEL